jgi:hypothetical protein
MAALVGVFFGLVIGLSIVLIFQTLVYPGWRMAHEKAKATATHGTDPSKVGMIVRGVCLVLLPLLGLILGQMLVGA